MITGEWHLSVTRRDRDVYLASAAEYDNGEIEWDAFGSRSSAMRWCEGQLKAGRLEWTKDGDYPIWNTAIDVDRDGNEVVR